MIYLVVDDDQTWIRFCQQLFDITTEVAGVYDKAIISTNYLYLASLLTVPVYVATVTQTVAGAKKAYEAGAANYFVKDYNSARLLELLNN